MKEQSQDLFSDRRVSLSKYSGQSIYAKTGWKIKLNGVETGLSIDQSVIIGLRKSTKDSDSEKESRHLFLTIKNITRCLVKYGVVLTSPEKDDLKRVMASLL